MRTRASMHRAQRSSGASTVRGGSHLIALKKAREQGRWGNPAERDRRGPPERLLLLAVVFIATSAVASAADSPFVMVKTTPLDFGQVYSAATFTGIGTVTVTAPAGLNFSVTWSGGFHYFAGSRHLKRIDGADEIPYNLFRDAGCSLALGDAGLGDTYPAGSSVAGTGNDRDQVITIYGRLTVPAQAAPGLYQDSIVVSVMY
jgi:spore coat protein U-like protein